MEMTYDNNWTLYMAMPVKPHVAAWFETRPECAKLFAPAEVVEIWTPEPMPMPMPVEPEWRLAA